MLILNSNVAITTATLNLHDKNRSIDFSVDDVEKTIVIYKCGKLNLFDQHVGLVTLGFELLQ